MADHRPGTVHVPFDGGPIVFSVYVLQNAEDATALQFNSVAYLGKILGLFHFCTFDQFISRFGGFHAIPQQSTAPYPCDQPECLAVSVRDHPWAATGVGSADDCSHTPTEADGIE